METVVVACLVLASGILAFFIATFINPFNKALKEQVSYWRGMYGDIKRVAEKDRREMLKELNGNDMVTSLVEQYPVLKPFSGMIGQVMNDPQMMQQLIQKVAPNLIKQAPKPAELVNEWQ